MPHPMFKGMPRPLTEAEADELIGNTFREIEKGGMWGKLCARCGNSIGGRLASHGMPTEEDLKHCCCPFCGARGEVKLEYIPPRARE